MKTKRRILVDAREFVPHRITGIGHFIEGLVDALNSLGEIEIVLASYREEDLPASLSPSKTIRLWLVPTDFLKSELMLSIFSRRGFDLFISPYPKLPLFGVHCRSVHTVHDVLDITFPLYRKRFKTFFDKGRLKKALRTAYLSWYVSHWSLKETEALVGIVGRNPRVRHNGVGDHFREVRQETDINTLDKYNLDAGYILIVGNGSPHKNIGLLLNISERFSRPLVFVGVSKENRQFWEKLYPETKVIWIEQAEDKEMPPILRQAFCLFQPSLAEGYGYPPLEAMACGIPAVVSNITVLVETTGSNALVADPQVGQSWIEAYQCLENNANYRAQVEKGLRWITNLRGRRGWMQHVADIEELLEERQ